MGSGDKSREAGSESVASKRTAELSHRGLGTAQPPGLDVDMIKKNLFHCTIIILPVVVKILNDRRKLLWNIGVWKSLIHKI